MKVVIVGAGALGSLYAACLARDGHDVSLVARGERAPALAKHGISETGAHNFNARGDIVTEPQQLRACDLLILATKTYDTAGALQSLRELKVKSAFSVQNGVQKNDALAQAFGASAVFGAVTMIGAEVLAAQGDEPCAVRYTRAGMTTIGAIAGGESAQVDEVVDAMQRAGLNVEASERIAAVEWSKFVAWSGGSAVGVLTRQPSWRFLLDPDTALLATRVMRETAAVGSRSARRSNPHEEEPHYRRRHGRVTENLMRAQQFGRDSGWLEVDGQRVEIKPQRWLGQPDHSWSVRAEMRTDNTRLPMTFSSSCTPTSRCVLTRSTVAT